MNALPLYQLAPESVEWLWPDRLAVGHLHLLDGDPGLGKSLLTLDLAARLSAGLPWPDGAPAPAPAPALVLNAEDGARDTTRARLLAAGADPARALVWEHAPGEPWPGFPSGAAALDELVGRTGA